GLGLFRPRHRQHLAQLRGAAPLRHAFRLARGARPGPRGRALMLVGLFVVLLVLITLGVPILLVMGMVRLTGMLLTPNIAPAFFPQKMFAMLDNFSLLALPYFILAGELIARRGISKKL